MNRRRERGSLGRLFRENTKTFLNDILRHIGMIPDSVDQMLAGMRLYFPQSYCGSCTVVFSGGSKFSWESSVFYSVSVRAINYDV